jgi:adenylate kinase family enzyme
LKGNAKLMATDFLVYCRALKIEIKWPITRTDSKSNARNDWKTKSVKKRQKQVKKMSKFVIKVIDKKCKIP